MGRQGWWPGEDRPDSLVLSAGTVRPAAVGSLDSWLAADTADPLDTAADNPAGTLV